MLSCRFLLLSCLGFVTLLKSMVWCLQSVLDNSDFTFAIIAYAPLSLSSTMGQISHWSSHTFHPALSPLACLLLTNSHFSYFKSEVYLPISFFISVIVFFWHPWYVFISYKLFLLYISIGKVSYFQVIFIFTELEYFEV